MLYTKQQGFTLIELIMVIVILGILSAFAIPKFANLSKSASDSVYDGYVGALKSALNIYHLKWLAMGQPNTAFTPFVSTPSVSGYPAGGSNLSIAFHNDCLTIFTDILDQENTPTSISGINGWSATLTDDLWAINASQLTNLGESSDIYCHYIYVGGYLNGAYSGEVSDRVPLLQYNIQTGELVETQWLYNP